MLKKNIVNGILISAFYLVGHQAASSVELEPMHGEENFAFDSISTKANFISQKTVSSRACGPTALFYALKLGSEAMRAAYEALPGTTDESKLKEFVDKLGGKPSKTSFHRTRFDKEDGTAPVDLLAMANDATLPFGLHLQSEIFNRRSNELAPGSFIKRIHQTLQASINKRVPVVTMFLPYVGIYKPELDTNEWSEHNGHFVLITGVPHKIDESDLGFLVQFLDPESGKTSQAYIYEEVNREFWARRDDADGSAHWIHPVVKSEGEEISSPFLGVTAPQLNLVPASIKHSQRLMVTLTTAIGAF